MGVYLFLLVFTTSVTLEDGKGPKKHEFSKSPKLQRLPLLNSLIQVHQCILSSFLVNRSVSFMKDALNDLDGI
jgi:hypothetical protein